jgi:hypothetical protein
VRRANVKSNYRFCIKLPICLTWQNDHCMQTVVRGALIPRFEVDSFSHAYMDLHRRPGPSCSCRKSDDVTADVADPFVDVWCLGARLPYPESLMSG